MSGQLHVLAVLPQGKETSVPIVYEAGCATEAAWKLWSTEKYLSPAGNRTPVVEPVACRYTK
jgi:hypothetical protein